MSSSSRRSSELCEVFFDKNLVQLTRTKTHNQGNILDLVLINCPERIREINVVPTNWSDHHQVFFNVLTNTVLSNSVKSTTILRQYAQADWVEMDCYLLDADFSFISSTSDVNTSSELLNNTIELASDLFIPRL